jgi:hypothetical protein
MNWPQTLEERYLLDAAASVISDSVQWMLETAAAQYSMDAY